MKVAVTAETDGGESRVAATPETVKKIIALGADVAVEPGAGKNPAFSTRTMPRPEQRSPPTP